MIFLEKNLSVGRRQIYLHNLSLLMVQSIIPRKRERGREGRRMEGGRKGGKVKEEGRREESKLSAVEEG